MRVNVDETATRRVRELRGPRFEVDPWRPQRVLAECERTADGGSAPCLTVFLTGAECPFTCVFCDLWRYTLEGPTPPGALPAQIEAALAEAEPPAAGSRLKLYNASNFFEPRAVPTADLGRIAALAAPFERVVVECHPRLVGESAADFARLLEGELEVAMGLETVHPAVLPRLNKAMTVDDFDRAAAFLVERDIVLRAFVLVGVPWLAPDEAVDWAVVSVAYALDRGAETVALIPLRGGNGELDRLAAAGSFRAPTLAEVERALERALALPAAVGRAVMVDPWDLERLPGCVACAAERKARVERMSRRGGVEPQTVCADCAGD